jgi:hypothetical protein
MVLVIAAIPMSALIRNPDTGPAPNGGMASTDRPVNWLNLLNPETAGWAARPPGRFGPRS